MVMRNAIDALAGLRGDESAQFFEQKSGSRVGPRGPGRGPGAAPPIGTVLLDAFENHGAAEIRATVGLGSQGNFVAFDDALAAERGGIAAHVPLDVEGDLIADN